MSRLLEQGPFAPRNDAEFLAEMNELSRWHLQGCPEYARIWPDWKLALATEELPYIHVGVFKHILFQTRGAGIDFQRTLRSSATTGAQPSRIALDQRSSALQAQSSLAILKEMAGEQMRPLLVLDDARALRQRGEVSARIAAAMALRPLASEIQFLCDGLDENRQLRWQVVDEVLGRADDLLVYGFTSILWTAWAQGDMPPATRQKLAGKRLHFVHSGGWKKLEALAVDRIRFDAALLEGLAAGSRVVDFYGLVEQVGVVFPLCDAGFRHVPRWADALVRDPWTLKPLINESGLLQLMNVLAWGAPYHNVLTEDLGRIVPGECPCRRLGRRFELLGRVPKGEVRGCANV
jgi:hypothetical protein